MANVYLTGGSKVTLIRRIPTGLKATTPPAPTKGQLWPRGDKRGGQAGS